MKGISNNMQISKAMELVSSSKMRRARARLDRSRPYYTTVLESIRDVICQVSVNHPLLANREVKKSLYIVCTADRGLAGGYNANINRLVHSKFQDKKDDIALIVIGSKGRDFFRRRGYNILEEFVGFTEEPSFEIASEIGDIAVDLFLKGEVDEINLVFTKFKTTLSYEPTILKILPTDEIKKEASRNIIEFEPSPDEVLDYLIPK